MNNFINVHFNMKKVELNKEYYKGTSNVILNVFFSSNEKI